jgi:hypothetical protein
MTVIPKWGMADLADVPPERHADRIIAAMMRDLAVKRAKLTDAVADVFVESKDGGPRAQLRMAERLRKAGAMHVDIKPGKRGKYRLNIGEVVGWNPLTDSEIVIDSPVPEKPWLAVMLTIIINRGRDVTTQPLFFITHHAFRQCALRYRLRTEEHMMLIATHIWNAVMDTDLSANTLFNPPPQGHRLKLNDHITVVVVKHHTRKLSLVVTTLFDPNTMDKFSRSPQ